MTRLLFIKLLRDLQTTKGRIALMVVAITLSLIAFGTVFYTRIIVSREIGASYMQTNPASATFILNGGLRPDQLAAIRAWPGVVGATTRAQFTAHVQNRNGEWAVNPIQLFAAAPDDPMQVARFTVEQGKWPPPPDGILIERNALKLINLQVGDALTMQTPGGKLATLKVTGVVHDPSLAPSFQEQKGYGFISSETLPLLGEPPVLDHLKIMVADEGEQTTPSRNRDTVIKVARGLGDWLQKTQGVTVEELQVPMPFMHPHQGQMDAILLAVVIFGGTSLVLSAILVATMLNGLLVRQIPQLGMLKAIGARSGRIMQFYLIMILLVAGVATALAVLPGIVLSRAYSQMLLSAMLNMDAERFDTPWWTYATVIGFGILVPVLMALFPLIKASRTTVRAAIDDNGAAPIGTSATGLDTWLARIKGLDRALLMGLRNMFRRRARLLLSIGLLATAGSLFVGGLGTVESMLTVADDATAKQPWDAEVRVTNPTSAATLANVVATIPDVAYAETWSTFFVAAYHSGQINVTSTYPDKGHGSTSILAVPPKTSFTIPRVRTGRWLQPDDTDAIVIDQIALKNLGITAGLGESVELSVAGQPTRWRIVGIVEELFQGANVYVSEAGFAQALALPGKANLLRIVTKNHDPETRAAVATAAERALEDASVRVTSAYPITLLAAAADGHMIALVMVVMGISIVMGIVGTIGLGSTVSANVLERTREFGVMRAIGARAGAVRKIVLAEGMFMALASCILAIGPALALTAALNAGIGNMFFYAPLPFRVSAQAMLIWPIAVIVGAALASLAPATRAARLTIRESLAYS